MEEQTEIFENKPISVYVKVNQEGFITEINSDVFLKDLNGYIKIDEGYGDRYAHAQSQYFDKPLVDEEGNYSIKL